MSDIPEYIKCARIVAPEDPAAEHEFMYEVKWVGSEDKPDENTWEKEALFEGTALVDDFWKSRPVPQTSPNDEGEFAVGATFIALRAYINKRILLVAAAEISRPPSRSRRTAPNSTSASNKRARSSSPSDEPPNPNIRRRQDSPLADADFRPMSPPVQPPPRPMIRPVIGSVLTFKKGKAVVQDRHRAIQDARMFRVRGGLFLQQHLRKERELRLAEAQKRKEEAQAAAAEEARRVAEALHEAEEAERIAEEERMAEDAARAAAEASERAARAAEWSTPRQAPEAPPKAPSPPPLKVLLAAAMEEDDLPDFEDDEAPAETEPDPPAAAAGLFGAPLPILSISASKPEKKKVDPYYWAKKLDEERKHKELMSRHPRIKLTLQLGGTPIDMFMKDITDEPPRPPNAPTVEALAGTIIDGVSMQDDVDAAITGVENGWRPGRSVARIAPVDSTHWAALEVLALQMFVEGKVIIGSESQDRWRPILFASEEEGIFGLLGASTRLANYKATLLITMVQGTD